MIILCTEMEPYLIDDAMFRVFSDLPENKRVSLPRSLSTHYLERTEKIYKERVLSKPITADELKAFVRKHQPEKLALMVMFNYNRAGEYKQTAMRYDIFRFDHDHVVDSWGADNRGYFGAPAISGRSLIGVLNSILDWMLAVDPKTHYLLLQDRIKVLAVDIPSGEVSNFVLDKFIATNEMIAEDEEPRSLFWPEFVVRVMELETELKEGFVFETEDAEADFLTILDAVERKLTT